METSKFQFKGFNIKRSFIEKKEGEVSTNFNLKFNPKGFVDKNESTFRLTLGILINDENNVLNVDIVAEANFSFEKIEDPKKLNKMFFLNAPAILFPYIRAYISTLSTLSGYKPITLPTMNLTALGKDLEKNTITGE